MQEHKNLVTALAVLVSALSATTSTSVASDPYYKGKTVNLIVGFSPGGGYDTYARTLARHIDKHIPGNPIMIVQNMPGAGSLKALLYLNEVAPTDGTEFASFNHGLLLESMTNPKKVKVKLSDFHFIGSTSRDFRVCYVWHATGIKSIKDVKGARQFILGGTSKGSSSYINGAIMRSVLGVNVKHVLGYPGSADQRIAVERGELSGDCGTWSSIPDDWIRDKKIVPLVQFSKDRAPDMPEGIPYVLDLVKVDQKKKLARFMLASNDIGKPYVMAKNTPMQHVRTMRSAFDATMNDPGFIADAKRIGLTVTPLTGAEAEAIVYEIYDASPQLVKAATTVLE